MRELAIEIGVRALLFGVFVFTEFLDPFQRVIQPEEIWLYKNPLVQSDNIPTRLMFAISFLTPLAVICVVKIIRRTDKTEIKEAFLAVSLALALNGVCTNTIKLIVGRWSDELGNALHRGPRPGVRGPQKLPQHPLLLDTAWRGVWSIRREIGSHRDGSPRPSQPFPVVLQLKDQRDGTWEHPSLHKESRGREICPHSHPLQGPLERRDTLLKSSLPVSFTGRPTAQSWLIGLVCLLLCWFFLFAFFFLKNSHSIKCMILKCAAWWVLARSQDCATTTV
uniref:WD repeat domain 11 n=1 Tax=Sus scrofa TaxID=9823 RepID=A0A8D0ZLH2_PIG